MAQRAKIDVVIKEATSWSPKKSIPPKPLIVNQRKGNNKKLVAPSRIRELIEFSGGVPHLWCNTLLP